MSQHFLHSTYREKLIEHLFVGGAPEAFVARAKMRTGNCQARGRQLRLRHHRDGRAGNAAFALKTTHRGAKASYQKVQIALGTKPSGCVIWIIFYADSLELGPYLVFAGTAGDKLPSLAIFKSARQTKPNSEGVKTERVNLRQVPKSRFKELKSIAEVYSLLFDQIPNEA